MDAEDNFFDNIGAAFLVLFHTFQYLNVRDLINCSYVSQLWNDVSSDNALWKIVCLDCKLQDFHAFALKLKNHGTRYLHIQEKCFDWKNKDYLESHPDIITFFRSLKEVTTLKKLRMSLCAEDTITILAGTLPQLESISLNCVTVDFSEINKFKKLTEIELVFTKEGYLDNSEILKELVNLKYLSVRKLFYIDYLINFLPHNLDTLVLGATMIYPGDFPTSHIPKLVNLRRLRVEEGKISWLTLDLVEAISKMPNMKQLELINFVVVEGFEKELARCTNLKKLMIFPYNWMLYDSFNNHQVIINGVKHLRNSLQSFLLGFNIEFVEAVQRHFCHKRAKVCLVGRGDSVPFKEDACFCETSCDYPLHIKMISLSVIEKEILPNYLPNTKFKLVNIPFSDTWDQQMF